MEACFVCCVPQKLVLTIQRQSILLQATFSDTSPKKNQNKTKHPCSPVMQRAPQHSLSISQYLINERQTTHSKDNLGVSTKMLRECKLCLYRSAMFIHFKPNYEHFLSVLSLIAEMCPADARHTRVCTHTKRVRPTANNKTCLTSPSVLLIAVLRLCCFCELGSLRGY